MGREYREDSGKEGISIADFPIYQLILRSLDIFYWMGGPPFLLCPVFFCRLYQYGRQQANQGLFFSLPKEWYQNVRIYNNVFLVYWA